MYDRKMYDRNDNDPHQNINVLQQHTDLRAKKLKTHK
jgi:hypothetical protein